VRRRRHADFVHALDDRDTEVAYPLIAALGRSVADAIARIVGELRHALAITVERVDVGRPPEMLGVLQAEDHGNFAGALHAREVARRVDAHQSLVVAGEE
jgi:hypothetical protein